MTQAPIPTRCPPPEQVRHAWELLVRPDNTAASIARLLGASHATLDQHVPELAATRRAPRALEPPVMAGMSMGMSSILPARRGRRTIRRRPWYSRPPARRTREQR